MRVADMFHAIFGEFGIEVWELEKAIAGGVVPSVIELRRGRSSSAYNILLVPDTSSSISLIERIAPSSARRDLIFAKQLHPQVMQLCRERGFDYVDLAGNVLLRFGDVYVEVQRKPPRALTSFKAIEDAPINLFSTKRSKVIFALLVWPELFDMPFRVTSEVAGASLGMVSQTIRLLRRQGYVSGDSMPKLVRKSELIDKWADSYATGLSKKMVLGRFRGEINEFSRAEVNDSVLISGESAVPWLLRPTTLTVYVSELVPNMVLANRWRTDGEHNIEVRRKFWKEPAEVLSNGRESMQLPSEKTVPSLLIYADLMRSGDGRQREAAQSFRSEHRELNDD